MSVQPTPLPPGLFIVSTPIGSARDITLRALDILASADVLAAEDTRSLRHLMAIHGVAAGGRPVISYHDHNGAEVRPRLLALLGAGKSVAYASEAGTPLVADPGFALVRAARAAGHPVTAAPGPSAAITALSIAGLPTDRFLFAGFPPTTEVARRKFLEELAPVQATLVLYESPKRLDRLLSSCREVMGDAREVAVCRELTKKFEEVRRAPLGEVDAALADMPRKGEFVVLIDRGSEAASAADLDDALREAMRTASVKDAARQVAEALNLPRREVYQAALALAKGE
ncbi:16S rRNA (cytidine(1402)-2'-O)-methyltransferase [Palleronia sp. KMU-117]|uniref:16S rRNA (cytidine(1402)-2'-O)-methyltransferase n=1 Tax=Palleronia sp. KMU-117 TaxID=3434108 RepID=UPI003D716702